jgi:hypothetical protein
VPSSGNPTSLLLLWVVAVSSDTLTGKWFYFCCLPLCVAYVACWFDCDASGPSAPVHVGSGTFCVLAGKP